jgi:hypothetical protein
MLGLADQIGKLADRLDGPARTGDGGHIPREVMVPLESVAGALAAPPPPPRGGFLGRFLGRR